MINFAQQQGSGLHGFIKRVSKRTVTIKTVEPGKERAMRFVTEDFPAERFLRGQRHIGQICQNNVKRINAQRFKQITLQEYNPVLNIVKQRIFAGDLERLKGYIHRRYARMKEKIGARYGQSAAPGADIQKLQTSIWVQRFEQVVEDELGFGPWDEHPGADVKSKPVKFFFTDKIGYGFAVHPPPAERIHPQNAVLVHRRIDIKKHVEPLHAEDVCKQNLRGKAGRVDTALLQRSLPVLE